MTRTGAGAPALVIGADLGTSRAKAVAYDASGRVHAKAAVDVVLLTPAPDRAEQDPDALLEALTRALRQVADRVTRQGARVVGVAFSGAMHSLLALDAAGRPLTRAIIWADNRAAPQARALRAGSGAGRLAQRTGTPIAPMSPLAKLRWFAEREPQLATQVARWVSVKEYVLLVLSGEPVVDHSIASSTGLFNLARADWDPEALALAGVDRAQLSTPVATTAVVGRLREEQAARLGLEPFTPLVAGAADGCLENLGAGAVDEGEAALTIGTSGAIREVLKRPEGDPHGRLFCYALTEDRWVVGGPINNGGLVPQWARTRLFPELAETATRRGLTPFTLVDELAGSVPAGADGLVCLPALVGERAPWWDTELRGVLLGLSTRHGREHVLRALLEGVAYQLAAVAEALEDHGRPIRAVFATGGFTASPLWLGIVAGALGRELAVPPATEGACFGAALLGLQALDMADAFALANRVAERSTTVRPDPAAVATYRQTYQVFRGLAERLAPEFAALAELRARADVPPVEASPV